MKAINMKTDYLIDPIGVDFKQPLLMWQCTQGQRQTAYQIVVMDDQQHIYWDSGQVQSASMRALYQGKPFASRKRLIWQVKLWDEQQVPGAWSQAGTFEIGLLKPTDWQASWVSGDYLPKPANRYPVDCFQKLVSVRSGLKQARLYVSACGLYEARINHQRVGQFVMAPGFTNYDKRLYYQTYDVFDLLKAGPNRLTLELADGWYRGSIGAMGIRNVYGKESKFIAQLELTYQDGTRAVSYTHLTLPTLCSV